MIAVHAGFGCLYFTERSQIIPGVDGSGSGTATAIRVRRTEWNSKKVYDKQIAAIHSRVYYAASFCLYFAERSRINSGWRWLRTWNADGNTDAGPGVAGKQRLR